MVAQKQVQGLGGWSVQKTKDLSVSEREECEHGEVGMCMILCCRPIQYSGRVKEGTALGYEQEPFC